MPYKDKKKQMEYKNRWMGNHKESVNKYQRVYQKEYQKKKWIEKYTPIIQKIQKYTTEDKAIFLSNIHGSTRLKIYKNFIIPFSNQIEKEIKKIKQSRYRQKTKKRIDDNWNFIKKWMIDRGCDCGEKNITKLSFHHLDPIKKENTIRKVCNCNMKKILKELKKGVVKCKNCHTIIHSGTSEEREEALINQYLKSSVKNLAGWRYKYRRENKLLIWELKKSLSCIKCGISDPVILLFHHIDSELKKEKICLLFKTSRGVINQEIAKTTCLCHNCHEDFHYRYGKRTANKQQQIEEYIGKKVIPINIDIRDYLPFIDQKISEYYDLPFLIT